MKHLIRLLFAATLLTGSATSVMAQNEVTLSPSKDNTLFENAGGTVSNGAGLYMFAGRTNEATNFLRRALVHFDVSGIPAGSTIESVELTMRMSRAISGAHDIVLHRVNSDWGEGTSNAPGQEGAGAPATSGDATWIHTFSPSSQWATPGGDFESSPSATTSVAGVGNYTWASTSELVADVQAWLDNPSSNFGWIVIGAEAVATSAKRFDTRESTSPPQLTVQFMPPNVAVEDEPEVPAAASLRSTYPNPFTETTTIEFEVSEPRDVTIEVYDTLGRRVTTLADGWHGAGTYSATFAAGTLPAGVYFVRLSSGDVSTYRQAVLMR